jgi:hypothetical protein
MPTISLEDALSAIANPTRWRILAELAGGRLHHIT